MIQSMTGYGKSILQLPEKKITIEIKSLNSKTMDTNVRTPLSVRHKELEIRKLIAENLVRGKVDTYINIEEEQGQSAAKVNTSVVKSYISQLQEITQEDNITELLKMAIRMPEALITEAGEIDDEIYKSVKQCLLEAIAELNKFRMQEGEALKRDFKKRIEIIRELLEEVKKIDPERSEKVREKLEKAVAEIQNVDNNRFEQELIYYLEKYDVTEEKTRLQNHLDYFIESLDSDDSNGRKLGFICQEIGREINTLGSKANYAPMQQIVVRMKDELEKIKEQILNVL